MIKLQKRKIRVGINLPFSFLLKNKEVFNNVK